MSGSKLSAKAKEFIPTFLQNQSAESAPGSNASAPTAATPVTAAPAKPTRLNPAASTFVPSALKPTAAPFVPGMSFAQKPETHTQLNGHAQQPQQPQQPQQQQKKQAQEKQQEQHTETDGEFNFFATPGEQAAKASEEEKPADVASPKAVASSPTTEVKKAEEQEQSAPSPSPSPAPQQKPAEQRPTSPIKVDTTRSSTPAASSDAGSVSTPATPQPTGGSQWRQAVVAPSPPPVAAPTPQRVSTWTRGEDVPVVTIKDVFGLADGIVRYLKPMLLDIRPSGRNSCPPELSRVFPDRLLTFHVPSDGGSGGGRRGQKGGRGGKGRKEEELPHPDEEKIFGEEREGAYKFRPDAQQDQDESERTTRTAVAILNKLSAGNFDKLSVEFCALPVESKETLDSIVDIILSKAQAEEFFSPVYADLCASLHTLWSSQDAEKGNMFKASLLEKCQEYYMQDRAEAFKKLEEVPLEDREEQELILKKTYIGHMRFIGELYLKDLLRARHIHGIIEQLLVAGKEQHDEEKMECLNKLLTTIGAHLERQLETDTKRKGAMNRYFKDIKKISADKTFSSRIRFMLQDLMEMRANRWTPRRAKEVAVSKGASKDQAAQPLPSPARRQRSQDVRASSRSSTPALEDEWQTVTKSKGGSAHGRDDHSRRAPAPTSTSGGAFQELAEQPTEKKRKPKAANGSPVATPSLESTPSDEVVAADPTVKEDMPSRLRDKAKGAMEEFIVGHDYDELKRCIDEWGEPAKMWQMVLDAVNMVFEKSDRERELLASTLVRLHSDNAVHRQQILFALQQILEAYDEMQIDIPKAGEYLGEMIGELVASRTVDMTFIANAPEAFQDSFSACVLIAHTIRGVEKRTDQATATELYKDAGIDAAKFVPFPEPEECATHVRECFAKVGVSYVLE